MSGENYFSNNRKKVRKCKKKFVFFTIFIFLFLFIFNFNSIVLAFCSHSKIPKNFLVTQAIELQNNSILIIGLNLEQIKKEYWGQYPKLGFFDFMQDCSGTYLYNPKTKRYKLIEKMNQYRFNNQIIQKENGNLLFVGGDKRGTNLLKWTNCNLIEEFDIKTNSFLPRKILDELPDFSSFTIAEKFAKNKVFIINSSYIYIYDLENDKILYKTKNNYKMLKNKKPIEIANDKFLIFKLFNKKEDYINKFIFDSNKYEIREIKSKNTEPIFNFDEFIEINNDNILCFEKFNNKNIYKYFPKNDTYQKTKTKLKTVYNNDYNATKLQNENIFIYYKPSSITVFPPLTDWRIPIKSKCKIYNPKTDKLKNCIICPDKLAVNPIIRKNGDILLITENKIYNVNEKFLR